jgi:murein DD-endopeptidase MepM/ murein hydrolase activator NlpD
MYFYQRFDEERKAERRSSVRRLLFGLFVLTSLLVPLFITETDLSSLPYSPSLPAKPESMLSTGPVSDALWEKVDQNENSFRTVAGSVSAGQTFASILSNSGLSRLSATQVIEALKPIFNCSRIAPGNEYCVVTNEHGEIVNLSYQVNPVTIYRLCRQGSNLVASKEEVPVDKRVARVSGEIRSSLFEAVNEAGEGDELAVALAELFAWDIDFRHDLQKGDRFTVLLEKYYKGDQCVRCGRIVAAEYRTKEKIYRAIFFKDAQGREDYFTPAGISVRRSLLRSPLKFTRISSRYSLTRYHPILHQTRPHLGVDFAAPSGTPVWSVGDGVIVEKGWKNGNGNTVSVRHPNGYETMYNHLSRYAKGIAVGKRVTQKDIVGYVGTTGLSTGPHLDYRMKKHGTFVDPLKEKCPPGFPVEEASRKAFSVVSQQTAVLLEEGASLAQDIVASR